MKRNSVDHKINYLNWKEKYGNKIPGISTSNSRIILNYINDMEYGLNVGKSSKKGGRSYNRLYNLQQRMVFITKKLEKLYDIQDLAKIEERQLHEFFTGMKVGDSYGLNNDQPKYTPMKITKVLYAPTED